MTASSAPRRRRDGQATRERIFREALHLFARKGFEATSIKDISGAVGVADAALYRYFASKDEIASAIFSHHYGQLAQAIAKIGAGERKFADIAVDLTGLLCELFDGAPDVFAFILLNQHDHLRFVGKSDNVVSEIVEIMKKANARGEIAIADENLAAAIALGIATQPAVFILYGRLRGPLETYRQAMENSLFKALGARPAP